MNVGTQKNSTLISDIEKNNKYTISSMFLYESAKSLILFKLLIWFLAQKQEKGILIIIILNI